MLDRHGRITLYVIVSSFSVYFLPTGLIGYTGVLLAITVVGVQLLLDEKFSFRMSHFPLLIYITWIIVSLIIGHQNSYSVPTLAFSFGPVALTILSIPLGRWLAESDQVLLRICWVVAILGTIIATVPAIVSLQGVAVGYSIFLKAGQLDGLAGYGAMLMITSIFTIPLVFTNHRYIGPLSLQFFALIVVGGRAALLGSVVAATYYSLLQNDLGRVVKVGTVAGLALLIGALSIYFVEPIALYLSNTAINELLTGRLSLWAVGRRAIFDNPVFGVGFRNVQSAFDGLYTVVNAEGWLYGKGAHNTFVRIGAALGMPGIIIYLLIYLEFFRVMLLGSFNTVRQQLFTAGVAGFLTFGLFESLLIGGASSRSLILTLFISAGLWTRYSSNRVKQGTEIT